MKVLVETEIDRTNGTSVEKYCKSTNEIDFIDEVYLCDIIESFDNVVSVTLTTNKLIKAYQKNFISNKKHVCVNLLVRNKEGVIINQKRYFNSILNVNVNEQIIHINQKVVGQ